MGALSVRLGFLGLALANFVDLLNSEWLLLSQHFDVTIHAVEVPVVPAQISALSEALVTELTTEGSLEGVFAEVVPQVAALAKGGLAALVLATEVQLDSLVVLALNLNYIVPLVRDTFEVLNIVRGSLHFHAFVLAGGTLVTRCRVNLLLCGLGWRRLQGDRGGLCDRGVALGELAKCWKKLLKARNKRCSFC